MENTRANDIVIQILQAALANKIKPGESVSPQAIAEAIASRVEFEKTTSQVKADKIIESVNAGIEKHKIDTKNELSILHEDEKMLANFIHGKLAAYNEILDLIKAM